MLRPQNDKFVVNDCKKNNNTKSPVPLLALITAKILVARGSGNKIVAKSRKPSMQKCLIFLLIQKKNTLRNRRVSLYEIVVFLFFS